MNISKQNMVITAIILLSSLSIHSEDVSFNNESKSEIINNLAKAIKDKYVLVDKGNKFSQELLNRHANGDFKSSGSKDDFVLLLNKNLFQITNDKHVGVRPERSQGPKRVRRMVRPKEGQPVRRMVRMPSEDSASMKKMMGLPDIPSLETKILPGNIGLLKVNDLMDSIAGVDSAMTELTDTDGLIIDVRKCPGGRGDISNQINSYFVPEGEEIMRMHTRGEDTIINRSATLPKGAKRYLGKPFYIVTSPFTGSACEAMSFALKYHDLGIVLGEKTAGAGHASTSGLTSVGFGLAAFIPDSRPEHPKHSGGFEKVGVTPDIETGFLIAVDQAYQMVLSQLLDKNLNDTQLSSAMIKITSKIQHKLLQQVRDSRAFGELIGDYSDQKSIVLRKGQLTIQSENGRSYPLMQETTDLFSLVYSRSDQKLRIDRDNKGNVVSIRLSPRSGEKEWQVKDKI